MKDEQKDIGAWHSISQCVGGIDLWYMYIIKPQSELCMQKIQITIAKLKDGLAKEASETLKGNLGTLVEGKSF